MDTPLHRVHHRRLPRNTTPLRANEEPHETAEGHNAESHTAEGHNAESRIIVPPATPPRDKVSIATE